MRKRSGFCIRTFQCPSCKNKVFATKLKRPTENGHIKTMYCPWCKADRDMEQVGMEKFR